MKDYKFIILYLLKEGIAKFQSIRSNNIESKIVM
jgi:hypothetical protein